MASLAPHPVFAHLPVELVYHVLSHLLLIERANGRLATAAGLMLVCRTAYDILHRIFYHTIVLQHPNDSTLALLLRPDQGHSSSPMRDIRRIHIFNAPRVVWDWNKLQDRANPLTPAASRLTAVDVNLILLKSLAQNCPDFAPREMCIRDAKFERLLDLPGTCLARVTRLRGSLLFLYINVANQWLGSAVLTAVMPDILARLPMVTHIAFDLALPWTDARATSAAHLDRYLAASDLVDLLRVVLARQRVQRVVLLLWGYLVELRPRVERALRPVQDERVFLWEETQRSMTAFDIADADARDALECVSVWDKGTRVYSAPEIT